MKASIKWTSRGWWTLNVRDDDGERVLWPCRMDSPKEATDKALREEARDIMWSEHLHCRRARYVIER